jgi:plastocyanin
MRTTRVVLAACAAALVLPGSAVAATYKVSAGAPANVPMPGAFAAGLYDADAYYPGTHSALRIHKGDRVTFSGGFHTATILGATKPSDVGIIIPDPAHGTYAPFNDANGAPFYWNGKAKFIYNPVTFSPAGPTTVTSKTQLYHSGILGGLAHGYTLKFNRTGTFTVVCAIHPGMKGKIQVVSRRRHVLSPSRQARRARSDARSDIRKAIALDESMPRSVGDPAKPVVTVGAGPSRFSLFAFYPDALSVKVGTTVTFRSGSINEPHNVGIGEPNYQLGVLLPAIDLFPTGPTSPNQVNPMLFYGSDAPAAGNVRVYNNTPTPSHGNGFLATDVVWKGSPLPGIAKETKVTFASAGTFTYMCQIHPNMVGTVNVHP